MWLNWKDDWEWIDMSHILAQYPDLENMFQGNEEEEGEVKKEKRKHIRALSEHIVTKANQIILAKAHSNKHKEDFEWKILDISRWWIQLEMDKENYSIEDIVSLSFKLWVHNIKIYWKIVRVVKSDDWKIKYWISFIEPKNEKQKIIYEKILSEIDSTVGSVKLSSQKDRYWKNL